MGQAITDSPSPFRGGGAKKDYMPAEMNANAAASNLSNIVDIQEIIENFAWEQFLDLQQASKKNEYRGLERDDVYFEVNLKKMMMFHDEPIYQNFNPTSSKPWTLFKTVFTNNTNRDQEYSFKTERTTESVCLICKEQGYMFGMEANLGLKTPCEVVEANAGFKHEITFNRADENSVSEALSWGVDSNIIVPAHFTTTAELVVEEMKYAGSFSVQSHFSGRVTVSLIRRRDSTLIVPIATTIVEVIKDALSNPSKASRELKSMCTIEQNKIVRLHSKGTCQFQFAMKQRVEINEEPTKRHRIVD